MDYLPKKSALKDILRQRKAERTAERVGLIFLGSALTLALLLLAHALIIGTTINLN